MIRINKVIPVATLSIFLLTTTTFAQDPGKIAKANFSAAKGQALYDSGKYEEAITPLEDAIKIRPEHGRAHYYLALTYEKLEEKERVVAFLESYLNYVKQTTEWLGSMDKEYIEKCKELLDSLKQASSPDEEEVNKMVESRKMSMAGSKYYYEKNYEQAINAFKKAIEIRPQDATANFSLAVLYRELGRKKEAIELLESYLTYVNQENAFLSESDQNQYIPQIKGLLEELKKEITQP